MISHHSLDGVPTNGLLSSRRPAAEWIKVSVLQSFTKIDVPSLPERIRIITVLVPCRCMDAAGAYVYRLPELLERAITSHEL